MEGSGSMNVAIVGTGYVGRVTGVCLAERGNKVFCVDNNPNVVEKLSAGEITIYEPGLEDIFQRNLKKERIEFTGNLEPAVLRSQVVFLLLPPPPGGARPREKGRGGAVPAGRQFRHRHG